MPTATNLLFDHCFTDMDEYAEQVGWDLGFHQLDAGSLQARAALMAAPRCSALRVEFNRAFHQSGEAPDGVITLGLPDPSAGEFRWCGTAAHGGDILNFNLENGFEGTSGAGFSGFTLSFTQELIDDVILFAGLTSAVRNRIGQAAIWTDVADVTGELRRQLAKAYRMSAASGSAGSPWSGDLLQGQAAARLLVAISETDKLRQPAKPKPRRIALQKILDWLNAHDRLPVSAMDLCKIGNVSGPTLYRAFQEEFGVGPKRYLVSRRLAGARKSMLRMGPHTRVTDIANAWGFWHMSQFAADYRRQFGELPSETHRSR